MDHDLFSSSPSSCTSWGKVLACLNEGRSFVFEVGVGAESSQAIIAALKFLLQRDGAELIRNNQKIACVTPSFKTAQEIKEQTNQHPALYVGGIHGFFWPLIKKFQTWLKLAIVKDPAWRRRFVENAELHVAQFDKYIQKHGLSEVDPECLNRERESIRSELLKMGTRRIDFHYRDTRIEHDQILLSPQEVVVFTGQILAIEKFRSDLKTRFPIVLFDEYQSIEMPIAEAMRTHLIGSTVTPVLGFVGDFWRKLGDAACGRIQNPNLEEIELNTNFRSAAKIVECLNKIRTEFPQTQQPAITGGELRVFYPTPAIDKRNSVVRNENDLANQSVQVSLLQTQSVLTENGWSFDRERSKILMLTSHSSVLHQHFPQLAQVFPRFEDLLQKQHPYIAYLLNVVEGVYQSLESNDFEEVRPKLGREKSDYLKVFNPKNWKQCRSDLSEIRESRTIGGMIDLIRLQGYFYLPDEICSKEAILEGNGKEPSTISANEIEFLRRLRAIPYQEIVSLKNFIEEHTLFSSETVIRNKQFENVLIIFGEGWSQYDFPRFLEEAGSNHAPIIESDNFERNRNLFYFVCSRATKRLALLFTQDLSEDALSTLRNWFRVESLCPVPRQAMRENRDSA